MSGVNGVSDHPTCYSGPSRRCQSVIRESTDKGQQTLHEGPVGGETLKESGIYERGDRTEGPVTAAEST